MATDHRTSDAAHPTTMRFSDLADRLLALPGRSRIIAIDGPGGAGKTTFAQRLSAATQSETITLHTDEFATPDEPTAWWPRLQSVIELLVAGESARFAPYDWTAGAAGPERIVEPVALVIIEGVSASRIEWAEHLAFSIWVNASPKVCRDRGVSRDRVAPSDWDTAAASEAAFFASDGAHTRADLMVDSGEPHDSETTFAVQAIDTRQP